MQTRSIRRRPVRLWRAISRFSGKLTFTAPKQRITFVNRCHTGKRKFVTYFVKQFTRPIRHRHNPSTRKIIHQNRNNHKLNHKSNPFTPDQVRKALAESKNSTADSPDKLTIHQLENLRPLGLRYLTKIFNLPYAHGRFPDIWKCPIIIPLLKTGKPKEQGAS